MAMVHVDTIASLPIGGSLAEADWLARFIGRRPPGAVLH